MYSANVPPHLKTENHSTILQLETNPQSPGLQALVRMLDSCAKQSAAKLAPRHFGGTKMSILAAVRRKILDRPLPLAAIWKSSTAHRNASLEDAALASCHPADTEAAFLGYEFWDEDEGGSPNNELADHSGSGSWSPSQEAADYRSDVTPERFFESTSNTPGS